MIRWNNAVENVTQSVGQWRGMGRVSAAWAPVEWQSQTQLDSEAAAQKIPPRNLKPSKFFSEVRIAILLGLFPDAVGVVGFVRDVSLVRVCLGWVLFVGAVEKLLNAKQNLKAEEKSVGDELFAKNENISLDAQKLNVGCKNRNRT